MFRRAILLALAAIASVIAPSAGRAQSQAQKSVTITGIVRDQGGRPLANAQIIVDDRFVMSKSDGSFVFFDAPADTIPLAIRRIGYEPEDVWLVAKPGDRVEIAVRLTQLPVTLGTIVVEGKAMDLNLFKAGFYERQKSGIGVFFDPQFLAARRNNLSALMREVPGLGVSRDMQERAILTGKVGAMSCVMNVFIDGHLATWVRETGLDGAVNPADLMAIEVYTRPEQVPAKLGNPMSVAGAGGLGEGGIKGAMPGTEARSGDCGAVMIWTKRPGQGNYRR